MTQEFQLVQLRAFATVARLGSFSKAAEQLSYSSPAVYLQVRSLEKSLGLPLIHRSGQVMALTPQGERLLETVDEILARADDLVQFSKGMTSASVEIGTGHHSEIIVPHMAAYLDSQTSYSVDLQTMSRGGLAQGLTKGTLDLVIGGSVARRLYEEHGDRHALTLARWTRDEWVFVGRTAHQMNERRLIGGIEQPSRVFLPESSTKAQWLLDSRLMPDFEVPPHVTMMPATLAILSAVANGLGTALLPLSRAESAIQHGEMVILRRFGRDGHVPIYVVHRRADRLSPAARNFVAFLAMTKRQRTLPEPPQLFPLRRTVRRNEA